MQTAEQTPQAGYRTMCGAQQVLRFVSLLYLAWYGLIAVGAVAAIAMVVLDPADTTRAVLADPSGRAQVVADGVVFFIDLVFNLALAISAWVTAHHPAGARRFRVFAGILLAISVALTVYPALTGRMASVISGLYSVFISGLLFYLANQIVRDLAAGTAPDQFELTRTPKGKLLRTERQVRRAIERGEIPAVPEPPPQRSSKK